MTYILLLCLLVAGYGVAILMARKIKAQVVMTDNKIDIEELVTKVAKAVAKEVASEFAVREVRGHTNKYAHLDDFGPDVEIDESIIPIQIDVEVTEANIKDKIIEEKTIDKDLEKSKTKLASIFNKRK